MSNFNSVPPFKRNILSGFFQYFLIVTIAASFATLSHAIETLKLNDSYALEAMDPKHRYADGLNQVYSKWSRIQEIAHNHFSSEDEAKKEFIKQLNEPGSKMPEMIGAGLDEKTRKVYQGGVTYMTPSQRAEHEVEIKDGTIKLKGTNERLPPGEHMFVIGPDKKVYAAQYERGHMHHSSFFSGGPVLSAGMITVGENGKIDLFTNKSGHYTPSLQHMKEAAKVLSSALSESAHLSYMEITTARDGKKSVKRQSMTLEKLGISQTSEEPAPPETTGKKTKSSPFTNLKTAALENTFNQGGFESYKPQILAEAKSRLASGEYDTPDKAESKKALERIVVTGAPKSAKSEMLTRVFNDPNTPPELKRAIGEEAGKRLKTETFNSEEGRQRLQAIQEEHLGLNKSKAVLHQNASENLSLKNLHGNIFKESLTGESIKSAKDTLISKRVMLHGTSEEKHEQAKILVEHALKTGNRFKKDTGLNSEAMHEMLHERPMEGGEHSVKGQVSKLVSSGHISAHEGVNIVKARQALDSQGKVELAREKVLASGLKMGGHRVRATSASAAANREPAAHAESTSKTFKPLPKTPARRAK